MWKTHYERGWLVIIYARSIKLKMGGIWEDLFNEAGRRPKAWIPEGWKGARCLELLRRRVLGWRGGAEQREGVFAGEDFLLFAAD